MLAITDGLRVLHSVDFLAIFILLTAQRNNPGEFTEQTVDTDLYKYVCRFHCTYYRFFLAAVNECFIIIPVCLLGQ